MTRERESVEVIEVHPYSWKCSGCGDEYHPKLPKWRRQIEARLRMFAEWHERNCKRPVVKLTAPTPPATPEGG